MLITTFYLMNSNNSKYIEARKMLVQSAIDKIIKVQNFNDFYQQSFYYLLKLLTCILLCFHIETQEFAISL